MAAAFTPLTFDLVYLSDGSGYYFPSQNRFVPSSGSFPRQQQTLNGFRSGNSGGYSPAPGSYQEQLLFIANENNSNNNNKQQAAIAANSPYGTPFGASSQQFAVSSNSQLTLTPAQITQFQRQLQRQLQLQLRIQIQTEIKIFQVSDSALHFHMRWLSRGGQAADGGQPAANMQSECGCRQLSNSLLVCVYA